MISLAALRAAVRKHALRAMARVLPYVPDAWVLAALRRRIASIPYEQGRLFCRRLITSARRVLAQAAPNCRRKVVENLLLNNYFVGLPQRRALKAQTGADAPYLLVISPLLRCNLHCAGCYATGYASSDDMPRQLFERALREARDLGVYFFSIAGGEPFLRDDLLDVFATFGDCYFQVYTNGTLLDEAIAARLAELGNVFPAISVEGFEAETDARRGPGTFQKALRAMAALRERRVPFGFSATATRQNSDLIVTDEFVDFWAAQGCSLGWYFSYIPVGLAPDPGLMPTPEQRVHRIRRLAELRRTRSLALADLCNDAPLVGGCLGAGLYYLHINAQGDVEPCVFCHFAVDNLREKPLRDVLSSDFFRELRARQSSGSNHLCSCVLTDHPQQLRDIVAATGARPTHASAATLLGDLAPQMADYAARYGALADELWETYRDLDPEGPRA